MIIDFLRYNVNFTGTDSEHFYKTLKTVLSSELFFSF